MSETIIEDKVLTYNESILLINDKYIVILNELIEKFKYHNELCGSLETDLKTLKEKLSENNLYVIDFITDNFLFCLEQISDSNEDYFIYQKEKVPKKNGKFYKNKLPKIGERVLFKKVLKECDKNSVNKLFKDIQDILRLLIIKDTNNLIFNQEYIEYVKNTFSENKNFSKMIMVFDNINNILDSKIDGNEDSNIDNNVEVNNSEDNKNKNNKKKNKKSTKPNSDFMKNLENTKIAQLAKNISEKINISDFPALSDPSKLLSSLGAGNTEEGGIQNLLKFVVGEVEEAFKTETLNEKDLMGEAQNIMGQFKNMSGFDPMSLLGGENSDKIDLSQFANIFSKMSK